MLMGDRRPFVGDAGGRPRDCSSSGFIVVEIVGSGFGGGGGSSATGESGGGGISVPSVRESRGARTGSSNLRDNVEVVAGILSKCYRSFICQDWSCEEFSCVVQVFRECRGERLQSIYVVSKRAVNLKE